MVQLMTYDAAKYPIKKAGAKKDKKRKRKTADLEKVHYRRGLGQGSGLELGQDYE